MEKAHDQKTAELEFKIFRQQEGARGTGVFYGNARVFLTARSTCARTAGGRVPSFFTTRCLSTALICSVTAFEAKVRRAVAFRNNHMTGGDVGGIFRQRNHNDELAEAIDAIVGH